MRSSTVLPLLLAVSLGTMACGADGGGPSDDAAGGLTSTTASTTTASTTTVATTTTTAVEADVPPATSLPPSPPPGTGDPSAEGRTPADAVRAWLTAISARDTEAAWELTHVASRDLFGTPEAFEAADAGVAEGYGVWGTSDDVAYSVVPLPEAGEAVSIVVLSGNVPMEGASALLVGSVPVRTDADGRHQVDPFQRLLGEGGLELHPEPGSAVAPDQTFEAYLVGGRNVSLIVDDEVVPSSSESSDGDRQHVTGRLPRDLGPGTHVLTVVVERDGAVQARSTRYTVAG